MELESTARQPVWKALWIVSLGHFLNDVMTTLVPSLLPLFQSHLGLTYVELGVLVLVAYVTSSLIQPVIGAWTDRRPRPWLLPAGVFAVGAGVAALGYAPSYTWLLVLVALMGVGSAAFHPEASRAAHLASGAKKGTAQSVFQVGGNAGQAVAPLIVGTFFVWTGLRGSVWMLVPALIAAGALATLVPWYRERAFTVRSRREDNRSEGGGRASGLVLLLLVVTLRSWTHAGLSGFLPLYYVNVRGVSTSVAELYAFLFLMAGALGTFFGGPLSDRLGKKRLILLSTAGAVPFSLALPYVHGVWAALDVVLLGFIVLSTFAVTVVFGQQLMPGRIGMVSGLMIGLAVGMGGVGASLAGYAADHIGIAATIEALAVLPLISAVLALGLPEDRPLSPSGRPAVR
ncbi:MAG: MFS transporter [Alicyclobacillaceae bacterium]|nr:MFS transporter [Alicyclobacillaceae bacterium]